ncbi:hypothetical protein CTAYLR_006753 [Chrysophaeum taylorii]|uniref:C2 domain-containing protein n=1 Tax=Chrysophaeum taylorii TaxID=2483200 RepID=A0AAD7XKR1_9STRA|nr:hypothetical protein CTAYLR_006753 [Chrysophaeum taylorii]
MLGRTPIPTVAPEAASSSSSSHDIRRVLRLHNIGLAFARVVVFGLVVARLKWGIVRSIQSGMSRVGALKLCRERHGALLLVGYLVLCTVDSVDTCDAHHTHHVVNAPRLVVLGLWGAHVALTWSRSLDPGSRVRALDYSLEIAPRVKVVFCAAGAAAFVLDLMHIHSARSVVRACAEISAALVALVSARLVGRATMVVSRAVGSYDGKLGPEAIRRKEMAVAARSLAMFEDPSRSSEGEVFFEYCALEATYACLLRLGGFFVVSACVGLYLAESDVTEAHSTTHQLRHELRDHSGCDVLWLQYADFFNDASLPLYWAIFMQPLFDDPPGRLRKPEKPWTKPPPRDGDAALEIIRPSREAPRDEDRMVEIHASLTEAFVIDDIVAAPVATLFAGRDSFFVAFEWWRGRWREVARSEILRNETNPRFARAFRVPFRDKIDLALVVCNLKDAGRNETPEWRAYSEGNNKHAACDKHARVDLERISDHTVVAYARVSPLVHPSPPSSWAPPSYLPYAPDPGVSWILADLRPRPPREPRAFRAGGDVRLAARVLRRSPAFPRDAYLALRSYALPTPHESRGSLVGVVETRDDDTDDAPETSPNAKPQPDAFAALWNLLVGQNSDDGTDTELEEVPNALHPPKDPEAPPTTTTAAAAAEAVVLFCEEMIESGFGVTVPAAALADLAAARREDAELLARRRETAGGGKDLLWLDSLQNLTATSSATYERLSRAYAAGEDGDGTQISAFLASTRKKVPALAFQPVNLHVQFLVFDTRRVEAIVSIGCFAAHALEFKKGGIARLKRAYAARLATLRARAAQRDKAIAMFTHEPPPPPEPCVVERAVSSSSSSSSRKIWFWGRSSALSRAERSWDDDEDEDEEDYFVDDYEEDAEDEAPEDEPFLEWPQSLESMPLDAKLLELDHKIQQRFDRVLCQALATIATCASLELERRVARKSSSSSSSSSSSRRTKDSPEALARLGLLVEFESLLSTHGAEKAMLEDYSHAVAALRDCVVVFDADLQAPDVKFDRAARVAATLRLPASRAAVDALGGNSSLRIVPVLFTQGINEMQSVANAVGNTTIQDAINRESIADLEAYFDDFDHLDKLNAKAAAVKRAPPLLRQDLRTIRNNIEAAHLRRKHWRMLAAVADFVRAIGGARVTSCKSGKDRTGMSVTFEQSRLLNVHHRLSADNFDRALYLSRLHGTRVENAAKNVGKPVFAFNAFQIACLPAIYRPPISVASQRVVS